MVSYRLGCSIENKDIKNKGVSVATLTYKVGANVSVYEMKEIL